MDKLFSAQGWAHYWAQGDALSHGIAYLLLLMSIASWFFILSKSLAAWRVRQSARTLEHFWRAPDLSAGVALLKHSDDELVFYPLAQQMLDFQQRSRQPQLGERLSQADSSVRLLRQQIHRVTLRLERGMTLLASIGATAPFVGLLGTVWGIYHSLTAVSAAGAAQIDKLAGPVGEALIMTGLGLVVAIPAVLAYNGLGRINRIIAAELDGFACDLQALSVNHGIDQHDGNDGNHVSNAGVTPAPANRPDAAAQ